MSFNAELAEEIAYRESPRDKARYFEGRTHEIRQFDNSLDMSLRREQAIFRIYQGAPGCGKTSLAQQLAETRKDLAAFIKLTSSDLTDYGTMLARVRDAASKQPGKQGHMAALWAGAALERLTGRSLSQEIQETAKTHLTDELRFVLHIDEAHSIKDSALDVLAELHAQGLSKAGKVPCVVLLTGLAHTRRHISAHPGLTRAGDTATTNMTTMAPGECAASTERMLAELDPGEADSDARQHLARMSAAWSFGWPRHLLSAQKAICEALLQAKGGFRDISFPHIEKQCVDRRADHYEERMQDVTEYPDHPQAFLHILAELQTTRTPQTTDHLALLCGEHINNHAVISKPPEYADAVAQHMVAKGLVERKDGIWTLPIPSMASWAEQELQRNQPSPTLGMAR